MRTKFSEILTLLLVFVVHCTFAQEKSISGTITDDKGLPLPGVNILIKDTSTGTQSDFDGKYSINTSTGSVLTFSYLGFKTKEVTVGSSNTINIQLVADASELEEVVVTAQGIKREKKALGYAVSTIKSDDIEKKPEADIARILTGKIAGVEVNVGGGFLGSGTNVIIRSKGSITGNNQPLYIVDGSPITGDRSFDLDPNNIESTSVLKGLAASTLYGEDGRNGVILITTKTGAAGITNKKFEISVSSTTLFTQIANLPDFQNEYGQGGDQTINTTFFGTWGARFNGQIVAHPLAGVRAAEYGNQTVEYKAVPDNVSDFFSAGIGQITSLQVNGNSGDTNYGVSVGHTNQTGYVAENVLDRLNLNFGGSTKLTNKFSVQTSAGFTQTKTKRPTRNLFTLLTWIPRNLDIHNLPFQDPITGESIYYRATVTNPRWQLANTKFATETKRFFGKIALDYDFSDYIASTYRYSIDTYNERTQNSINRGGTNAPLGFLSTFNDENTITNHDFIFYLKNLKLTEKISFNSTLGANFRNIRKNVLGINSTDQALFGVLNHDNFRAHNPINADEFGFSSSEQNRMGVYGSLDFDYDQFIFLTLSGRNDWASTTEAENRSLFYPSASLSFIPTSAFPGIKSDAINYLKLRAGYGSSASFPRPYLTRPSLASNNNAFINPFTGATVAANATNTFRPNPDIKPELLTEIEVGVEGKFFNNKVSLDLSVYQRISKDQILFTDLPNSTGFLRSVVNAGRIDTEGIEAGLNVTAYRNDDFEWNINTNFTAYESTVIDLPEDNLNIAFGRNFAVEGEPLGVFRGTYPLRDSNGNLLINPANGKIIANNDAGKENKIIGDPNEDWRATAINTISYKGLTLSAQLEYIHGGDIWSDTATNLLRRGVTTDTQDREGTFVIPGIYANPADGTILTDTNGNTIPNTIQLAANDLYFLNLQDVDENIVYDASVIRLRDVSLSYTFTKEQLEQTPFGSVVFTLSGNNLWYETPNIPKGLNLDPGVLGSGVGNGKGIDFQNDPSYKQYSIGVKLTF